MDLFFQFLNEWIKLRNVPSIIALFMFSEAEQVRDVLRSPAVEVEFILLQQQLPQRFISRARVGGE